jgi:hypothetical protein
MQLHLVKSAKEILRQRLTEVVEEANNLLDTLSPLLFHNERKDIQQSIKSRAIPTPKLLIKDHKKPKGGMFPTRLVIPVSNFTSAFPKLGYLGIKHIFDDNHVPYTSRTIHQAADLKSRLEALNLRVHDCTILVVSIDAVDYYPSVRFKLVQRAIQSYSRDLPVLADEHLRTYIAHITLVLGSYLK